MSNLKTTIVVKTDSQKTAEEAREEILQKLMNVYLKKNISKGSGVHV